MDILDLVIKYGLYAVAISVICFFVCGIAKLFFVEKLKSKIPDDALRQKKIREICQAITIILGSVLLVLCYTLLLHQLEFYLSLDFYLSLVAIPSITAMIYTIYQGKQDGKVVLSLKQLCHFIIGLIVSIFTKKGETEKTGEQLSKLDKEIDEVITMLPADKDKLHTILSKYIKS